MSDFKEAPARMNDPATICPGCGHSPCAWASDFKKFGEHSIRCCGACGKTFENGKEIGPFVVHQGG